jgi:hypothetical protein
MRSSRNISAVLRTSQRGLFRKLLFLGALNVGRRGGLPYDIEVGGN